MHKILGWNNLSMLGGKASHTRTSVAGSAVHCKINKDMLYWINFVDWGKRDWQFSTYICTFYQLFCIFIKYVFILEENYKYCCGSIFCGHCSMCVCIHMSFCWLAVYPTSGINKGHMPYLNYWMKPVHITYFYPDYGQQPKKIISWQQETNEITQMMGTGKDNTWN